MFYSTRKIMALATMITSAISVTPVSDSLMTTMLNDGGVGLALAAAPMWFFGQALNQPPCYPTWAIQNGQQTSPAATCGWPNTGCNCRKPGVAIGNPGPNFPVYYSYNKCNDNEVRVAYNIFFEKDGFNPNPGNGHAYDWERVIVVWRKESDGQWRQNQLFMGQHSGYDKRNWGDIQNTFETFETTSPLGGSGGRRNLDHPKVYVAWSKHAIFHTRNTGWNDIISQSTGNAFRSQDWWYYVPGSSYIRADSSTAEGQAINMFAWGSADSTPPRVHDGLCVVSNGNYTGIV
ncbi:hypothetical protein M501DRAFT_990044 [Patellaria atrata CBS 101060]|uniref:Uncharacterized protein n=1 Tax=Patellaria atrata CBS 101060 TaxID=1346257 RepID=A0A9P4SFF1_9PEZI|nr:hypothetical protein M501DRAFT_990044 [Patellaria atrata CBS 101060]